MTKIDKQKIADFLDIAADHLSSGYKKDPVEYNFNDDEIKNDDIIGQNANELERNADSIEQVAQEIITCRNCTLWERRTNAAPGEGAEQPLVMVIGEGPGEDEDRQGRPFVGRAGQLLDKMLDSIGLSRNTNCFIANVVKCRPPFNRDPYPEETAKCAHFLKRQITLLKPKFILVVGRIAAQSLLQTTESIGKMRGKFTELSVGDMKIPLIVTYHPAALLRNEEYKRPAWEDLKLLHSKFEN
jgi:DNA polymerase